MKVMNWIEVSAPADEYRNEVVGYFPTMAEAEAAKLYGWYGAKPSYHQVMVIELAGSYFKLNKIKKGPK
jgi:hypothetical protein